MDIGFHCSRVPEGGITGFYSKGMFNLQETAQLFSRAAAPLYSPIKTQEFRLLQILSTLGVTSVFT